MPDSHSLKEIALGDLEVELDITRQMFERVPEEHLDWRPRDDAYPLGSLAAHTANLLTWQTLILSRDELDLASVPPPEKSGPASKEELLRLFDEKAAELRRALAETDDDALLNAWTVKNGEKVVLSGRRISILRRRGISHMVHHRAQLGLYLKMLGVELPPSY